MDNSQYFDFVETRGYEFDWEQRSYIMLNMISDILVEIKANPAGFRTLASHFYEIAYGDFPTLLYHPGDLEDESRFSLQLTKTETPGRLFVGWPENQNSMREILCATEKAYDSAQTLFLHYLFPPQYSANDLMFFANRNINLLRTLDIKSLLLQDSILDGKRKVLEHLLKTL